VEQSCNVVSFFILQKALEHPAAQARTGGLPSMACQMGLLVQVNQGREAQMAAVGAVKMVM
jgi:hypothetical protein